MSHNATLTEKNVLDTVIEGRTDSESKFPLPLGKMTGPKIVYALYQWKKKNELTDDSFTLRLEDILATEAQDKMDHFIASHPDAPISALILHSKKVYDSLVEHLNMGVERNLIDHHIRARAASSIQLLAS